MAHCRYTKKRPCLPAAGAVALRRHATPVRPSGLVIPITIDAIDAAVAAILSWEARTRAIAAGTPAPFRSVYEDHGIRFVG